MQDFILFSISCTLEVQIVKKLDKAITKEKVASTPSISEDLNLSFGAGLHAQSTSFTSQSSGELSFINSSQSSLNFEEMGPGPSYMSSPLQSSNNITVSTSASLSSSKFTVLSPVPASNSQSVYVTLSGEGEENRFYIL